MTKVLSNKTSITASLISLLFFFSSLAVPTVMAAPSSSIALAATPLSALQANWAAPDGNPFNQNFNPQTQINSSNAQYLGLSWLFPLPSLPPTLQSLSGGLGVGATPMIINGTIYAVTNFGQAFALNAANGNVIWSSLIPILPNSSLGHYVAASVRLHLHNGHVWFTTQLFNHTPTLWVAAGDNKVWAINALNGKFELNFSDFNGASTIAGNSPGAIQSGPGMILVDQNKGILISSEQSGTSPATGRCFYRGWNILVTPPQMMWESYCTPPQAGGSIPVDPNWAINQVNSMKGAQIFYPGPAYNAGGFIPGTAVVDLKTISAAQLNSTLYDDWGQVNQSPACKAVDGGLSTGSTAAGWGSPWLVGSGPTAGLAFVNTNNRDPYTSPCIPGPNLWSAAILAINETSGKWVWGFQAAAHEAWDYDCSWQQTMGTETVNGVSTQVIWKTCKNGYLYELNAQTGALIWAWSPPVSILPRCPGCFMYNPLNRTQMTSAFFNFNLQPALMYPSQFAAFENEGAYSPTLNYLFLASQNVPQLATYVAPNSTNYKTNSGIAFTPPPGASALANNLDNSTIEAVNAATGQMVWSHYIPTEGFRGGLSTSGNVVFVALSSGDILMLNAQTGATIKDQFIGGPLNVLPSIGATANGQMEIIVPIFAGAVTWAVSVPGDIVALTLQNVPAAGSTSTVTTTATSTATTTATTTVGGGGSTVTTTATTTATTTVGGGGTVTTTATTTVGAGATVTTTVSGSATTTITAAGSGVDTTTLYAVAAIAAIFIIATGYLAMRGRKPAS
jgi:outer membrane protein assembly factor BamB